MQRSELYYNFIDNEKCENELAFRIYIFEEIIATSFLKFVKTNFGAVCFFFFLEKKKKRNSRSSTDGKFEKQQWEGQFIFCVYNILGWWKIEDQRLIKRDVKRIST